MPEREAIDLEKGRWKTVDDAGLRGANDLIRTMIAQGQPTDAIVGALNRIRPKFGDSLAAKIAPTVAFRQQHGRVPMANYSIDVERQRTPMGWVENLHNQTAQSAVGAAAMSAADGASWGHLADMTADPARTRAAMGLVQGAHPIASTLGYADAELLESELGSGSLELLSMAKPLKRFRFFKALEKQADPAASFAINGAKAWLENGPEAAMVQGLLGAGKDGFAKMMFPQAPKIAPSIAAALPEGFKSFAETQIPAESEAEAPPVGLTARPSLRRGMFAAKQATRR